LVVKAQELEAPRRGRRGGKRGGRETAERRFRVEASLDGMAATVCERRSSQERICF